MRAALAAIAFAFIGPFVAAPAPAVAQQVEPPRCASIPTGRLPSVCLWKYPTFYCEAEQLPPEGWLRPGGYCDQVVTHRSLIYTGTKGLDRYVQPG